MKSSGHSVASGAAGLVLFRPTHFQARAVALRANTL